MEPIPTAKEARELSMEGVYNNLGREILKSTLEGRHSLEYTLPEYLCDFSSTTNTSFKDLPANWVRNEGHNLIRKLQGLGYNLSLTFIQLVQTKHIVLIIDWSL